MTDRIATPLTRHASVDVPLICGAMYPCSNPELVAAVSEAGGIGVVQPVSLVRVHGYDFREGLAEIRRMTRKPIGMNALIERTSKRHHERMVRWVDVALEEGVRFFVTSLGKPRWVVDRVRAAGGVVYHDVTERAWALKGVESGVDGLVAVNRRAGGHAGPRSREALLEEIGDLGLPVVCAGGVGTAREFAQALDLGYAGAQLGTRFIATSECTASRAYKEAIVRAGEEDVVLTSKLTGIPVSVLNTRAVRRMGTSVGPLAKALLKGRRAKRAMRLLYWAKSLRRLERSLTRETEDLWQAGKSVAGISSVEPAGEIVRRYARAAIKARRGKGASD